MSIKRRLAITFFMALLFPKYLRPLSAGELDNPTDAIVVAIREWVDAEHNQLKGPRLDDCKRRLLAASNGQLLPSDLSTLENSTDQADLNKVTEKISQILPPASKWYVKAWVDPILTEKDRHGVTFVCGQIISSRKINVQTASGKVNTLEIVLGGDPILGLDDGLKASVITLGIPSGEIVLLENNFEQHAQFLAKHEADLRAMASPDQLKMLSVLTADDEELSEVGDALAALSLKDCAANDFMKHNIAEIAPVTLARLHVTDDQDFLYCLRHSGLNNSDKSIICTLRAAVSTLKSVEQWQLILSTVIVTTSSNDPSYSRLVSILSRNQVKILGAAIAKSEYHGSGKTSFTMQNSFLRKDLSNDEFHKAMTYALPRMLAQMNIDLLACSDALMVDTDSDPAIEQRIYANALRDFPDGLTVQLAHWTFKLGSDKPEEKDQALHEIHLLADKGPDDYCRSSADQILGREAYEARDFKGAQHYLENAYSLEPRDPNVLYRLFATYVALRDPRASEVRDNFFLVESVGKRADLVRSIKLN